MLAKFENKEADVVNPEHDGALILVAHVGTEVSADYHMPASSKLLVQFVLYHFGHFLKVLDFSLSGGPL